MSAPPSALASSALPRTRLLSERTLPLRVGPLALLTCLEGELTVRAAGELLRVRRGELLVLRRGAALELEQSPLPQRLVLFEAPPAWVEAFWGLHGTDPEAGGRAGGLELVPVGSRLARRAVQLLASSPPPEAQGPLAPSSVAALLELAFQTQGSRLTRSRTNERSGQRQVLIQALADYDPEVDGDFSLHGLAEHLGLSSRQTARIVRGETGRSFRELKAAARIERARKLLVSSDLSILEVALRAGWNSASQFHDAFRRSVGVTPARYRGAHRG